VETSRTGDDAPPGGHARLLLKTRASACVPPASTSISSPIQLVPIPSRHLVLSPVSELLVAMAGSAAVSTDQTCSSSLPRLSLSSRLNL
jgi:hypothetical protein